MDHNCTPSKKKTQMGRFWDFFFHSSKLYNKYTRRANCIHCGKRIVAPKTKLSPRLQAVVNALIMASLGAFTALIYAIFIVLPHGFVGLAILFSGFIICDVLYFLIMRSISATRLARGIWILDDISIDISGSYVDERKALLDEDQFASYILLWVISFYFYQLFYKLV